MSDSEIRYRVLCHKYLAEVERQDAEIERLREELRWRGEKGQPGSCLFCGSHRSLHRDNNISQMDCAAKRIAELELQSDMLQETVTELGNQHIITTDQIRAAWELLKRLEGIESRDYDAVYLILEELGIVGCEGCGGSGVTSPTHELDAEDCVNCNDEGWVKDATV